MFSCYETAASHFYLCRWDITFLSYQDHSELTSRNSFLYSSSSCHFLGQFFRYKSNRNGPSLLPQLLCCCEHLHNEMLVFVPLPSVQKMLYKSNSVCFHKILLLHLEIEELRVKKFFEYWKD